MFTNLPLRKHPIFFNRGWHLKNFEKDEFKHVENLLLFEMPHIIHAYAYREIGCRKRTDIVNFFLNVFFPKGELGIVKEVVFHKYKKQIFKIIDLYDVH